MTDYSSFSEVISLTEENKLRFCKESNLIEGITNDLLGSPFIDQHLAAFDYVISTKRMSIRKAHEILMKGIMRDRGKIEDVETMVVGEEHEERKEIPSGVYRKGQTQVYIGKHKGLSPDKVEESMSKLEADIDYVLKRGYKPDVEWEFHNRFEDIHPFVDGNGRTGRLLLNFIRMQYFPGQIIIVRAEDKILYYKMLDEYRKQRK